MKTHAMSCEFPEGCSCGADEWNRLESERDRLRKIVSEATHALEGGQRVDVRSLFALNILRSANTHSDNVRKTPKNRMIGKHD